MGNGTTTVWWGVAGVLTAVLGGAGTKHDQMHDATMYIDVNRERG